jgi:hypothetical protein
MLKIRQDQMDVFAAEMRANYEQRVVDLIQEEHTKEVVHLTTAAWQQRVPEVVDKAWEFEIYAEEDVAIFLVCLVQPPEDFATDPRQDWPAILGDNNLDGHQKVERIQADMQAKRRKPRMAR